MITPADAAEVMRLIAACHPRTAPRMDDRQAATATAVIWADLFNKPHRLELRHLLAGVQRRVTEGHPDAPEPAEIITYARKVRRDEDDKTGPTPEYEQLCESKAEDHAELAANRQRLNALVGQVGRTINDA